MLGVKRFISPLLTRKATWCRSSIPTTTSLVPALSFPEQDLCCTTAAQGFTLIDGLPNTVAPGKHPFHTLIPAFITKPGANQTADGSTDEPYMSFGLMGGAMQAQGHAQFVINHLVFGLNIQEAQDVARFRHMSGARTLVETVIPESTMSALRALGHDMAYGAPSQFGGSQAIIKLTKGWVAGSDPRKDGHAGGN